MSRRGEKTVVITGASRGIGRAVAIELSKSNLFGNIVLVARTEQDLVHTKRLMTKVPNVSLEVADLENSTETVELVRRISKKYECIDVLVNVAGFVNPKSLLDMDLENWEKTFSVNVTSVFLLTREVVRIMKKTGGKILNIASTAGMSPRPGWSAYAASKAALISLSLTLSQELEEYDIKVYCVSPGRCATDLRRVLAPDEDPTTIMQPQEVAEVVATLLSPKGDCLDGQNIVIRRQLSGVGREKVETAIEQVSVSGE